MADNTEVIRLVVEMKESLERQMAEGFDQMGARFDAIDSRLDRQGGLIRAGQTNLVRLNEWSENIDQQVADLLRRVTDLERRKQQ